MSKHWDLVLLKEILTPVERPEVPVAGKIYRQLGVRLWGEGAYERESLDGMNTKYKKLSRTEADDIIVNKIWARNGSVTIVPSNLAGCYVSNEFPSFTAVQNRLFPNWFYWFTKTKFCWQQCDLKSRGTSGKNRIRPEQFLEVEIPLPPLEEQRRIVGKIEALAEKIEEVRSLRLQTIKETEALIISSRIEIFNQALNKEVKRFDEIACLERGKFSHRPRNDPRFFGGDHPWIQIAEIESSGKYIKKWTETLNEQGLAISRKFKKGTLLISIAATIGAVGILTFDCCIPDSIVAITPKENMSSEYIYYYLCYLRTNLERIAPQSAQKNINLKILQPLPVPIVPLPEQKRIVEYLDRLQSKIDEMKKEREKALEEMDALLPSILDKAFKGEL